MNDPAALIGDPDARSHYRRLKCLDEADVDVTTWEADFLESTLRRTGNGQPLTDGQLKIVKRMETRYLGYDY